MNNQTKASNLRAQALVLLKEAVELEPLYAYPVIHRHEYGYSTYLIWASDYPSEADATMACGINYEPDRCEEIEISFPLSLEELTGISDTNRLSTFQKA